MIGGEYQDSPLQRTLEFTRIKDSFIFKGPERVTPLGKHIIHAYVTTQDEGLIMYVRSGYIGGEYTTKVIKGDRITFNVANLNEKAFKKFTLNMSENDLYDIKPNAGQDFVFPNIEDNRQDKHMVTLNLVKSTLSTLYNIGNSPCIELTYGPSRDGVMKIKWYKDDERNQTEVNLKDEGWILGNDVRVTLKYDDDGKYKLYFYERNMFRSDRNLVVSLSQPPQELQLGGGRKRTMKRRLRTGPKGGKYYLNNGRKVYV